MQTRPANWETLLYDLNHKTEYRYIINGVEYTGEYVQGVPVIDKPMMLQPVIGRCCTGTFSITVRKIPNVSIPKAAPVSVSCRLVSDDGATVTDWIPQGSFWITKRSGYGELITLTCRDNMILAGRSYTDKTEITEWPAPMSDVFEEIVALMNVDVDPRTIIHSGSAYMVDYPNDDALMSEILSMIAAAHGGNFIMTESGKLRLVPLPDTETPLFDLAGAFSDYVPYSTGIKTISRVTITDDAENTFTNGDDTGVELVGVCNYCTQLLVDNIAGGAYIANGTLYANGSIDASQTGIIDEQGELSKGTISLFASGAIGKRHTPYRIAGAYFDPCIELGDTFSASYLGEDLTLIANSITVECTQGYYCSLENGVQEDDEEEIPYVSPAELQAKRYLSTGKTYFGNRINRTEGFVSEYTVNDVAVARMIANSNLFTMQRKVNGNWENVLYFNPVDMQYHFTGEVTIDTSRFAASSAVVDNPSIVVTADENGVVGASTHVVNVIAYTGDETKIPVVSGVSGLPTGMTASIGTAGQNKRLPIAITIADGSNLGSADSCNGTFKITVTSPVSMDINVNWAKVNTGIGIDGTNGYNTANVVLYQRSATVPAVPSEAVVYNFATGAITGSIGSWVREIPTGTDPCYATFALVTSTEGTIQIPTSKWTTPSIVVQNGEDGTPGSPGKDGTDGKDGYNTANVMLYQRAATQPGKPSGTLTYTFSTGAITGSLGNWTRSIPAGDDPCYATFVVVTSKDATAQIASSDWSTPAIVVQDGVDGQDGRPGTDGADGYNTATVYLYIRADSIPTAPAGNIVYTFATAAISGETSGWSRNIPATNGSPCWCIGAQAVGKTSTVTLTQSSWSDPVKLVEDGADGEGSTTYCQNTAPNPSFLALHEGDLWVDTSDGTGETNGNNALYRWDGSQWVSVQDLNIPTIITALTSAQSRLDILDTEIESTVDATYVTNQLDSMLQQFNSTLEQTAQDLTATFNVNIESATGAVDTKYSAYIRANGDGVEIGRSDSALKCVLNNERLSFVYNSGSATREVAYFANDKLFITYAQITDELVIGSENDEYGLFKWTRTRTGLGLKYVNAL